MDLIKSYLVSKENVLIQLKTPALPCVAVMLSLPIPSVFTDHNLERNEDLGCHNFCDNLLEVKGFSLLYSGQTLLTGRDLLHVYNRRKASLWGGWTVSCSPCECLFLRENLEQ